MRKVFTTAGCFFLAVALSLAGSPAQAGEFSIADPAGDATGIHTVESTPRPSDPELDILGVKYLSTPTEFKIHLKMAKIGIPVASIGYSNRLGFTHSGTAYHFLYQVTDAPGLAPIYFALRQGSTVINCKCSGKVNAKTATLEVTADIASLSKALKSFKADSAPIGPGTAFSTLSNSADRLAGAALVAADWAKGGEATFKF